MTFCQEMHKRVNFPYLEISSESTIQVQIYKPSLKSN